MELMPDKSLPSLVDGIMRIFHSTEPVCHDTYLLGCHSKLFIPSVEILHLCYRSIASGGMDIHKEFAIEHRKFRIVPVCVEHIVDLRELHLIVLWIPCCATDRLHGKDTWRATSVAVISGRLGTIITEYSIYRRLAQTISEVLVICKIIVFRIP